jgi:Flp pilus assembly CpaF family ATPase
MGVELSEADGERIIRLVAAHVGAEVHRGQPLLSAELPETGERFEGILPPAAPGPAFALRKRAIGVIPLERYVIDGMMTSAQAGFLVRAVRERQNVLIAGATSSGKTTLANALLAEIAATGDRVLVLEDTVELQCAARDHVPLRTRAGVVSMTELVRSSMRLRLIASSSARCAAPRRWISSRCGARATPAASPRSMPAPRSARCCAWSN